MAKFNSAWLIGKRQFRSLTGVDADTSRELVGHSRLKSSTMFRQRMRRPEQRASCWKSMDQR